MYSIDNVAKRVDLLLRSKHPEFLTEIFQIDDDRFEIVITNCHLSFDEVQREFNHSIRPVAAPVFLSETMPSEFLQKIAPITDQSIPNSFSGKAYRAIDLLNLLSSKFPDITFNSIHGNDGDNCIKIHILAGISQDRSKLLQEFAIKVMPIECKIIEDFTSGTHDLWENDALYIYSPYLSLSRPRFEERDEDLWYSRLDDIYSGNYSPQNFSFYQCDKSKCFVDASQFENINIRNQLLLYDTVFLAPPIEKPISEFFEHHKIKSSEFYELLENGRINLLLTQPTNRYNKSFIEAAQHHNEDAIISRRAINAAVVAELSQINKNYLFNGGDYSSSLVDISEIFSSITGKDSTETLNILSWPIKALRQSFEFLDFGSPLKIGAFGINTSIQEFISKSINRNLELEFTISSSNAHIASALNASYFPFGESGGYSDRHYVNIMTQLLSFYKHASLERILGYQQHIARCKINPLVSPQIAGYEVNEYVPVKEFEKILTENNLRPSSQSFLTFLSEQPESDRRELIARYDYLLNEKLDATQSGKRKYIFSYLYTAAIDFAGLFIPFLGTGEKMGKAAIQFGRKKFGRNEFEALQNRLEQEKISDELAVKFLEKLNPIARVK